MNEREWIESIPKFECSDGRKLKFPDEFIKDKLRNALSNENIVLAFYITGVRLSTFVTF